MNRHNLIFLLGIMLLASLFITQESIASPQPPESYARVVRRIDLSQLGISNPRDLAYWKDEGVFLLKSSKNPNQVDEQTMLSKVTMYLESFAGNITLDGINLDQYSVLGIGDSNQILLYEPVGKEVLRIRTAQSSETDPSSEFLGTQFLSQEFEDVISIAFDPVGGQFLILDGNGNIIFSISNLENNEKGQPKSAISPSSSIDAIGISTQENINSIAYHSNNDHIYALDSSTATIYELSAAGDLIGVIDLKEYTISNPRSIISAPSGDPTDDPGVSSLYILETSSGDSPSNQSEIIELSLEEPKITATPQALASATFVRTIYTSGWSPPSPDPAGITYWGSEGALLVSDSEVNEMPPYFTGDNVFKSSISGVLLNTYTTIGFSNEPTGVSWNYQNNHIFYSNDDDELITEVNPGPDSIYGTQDDIVTTTDTAELRKF